MKTKFIYSAFIVGLALLVGCGKGEVVENNGPKAYEGQKGSIDYDFQHSWKYDEDSVGADIYGNSSNDSLYFIYYDENGDLLAEGKCNMPIQNNIEVIPFNSDSARFVVNGNVAVMNVVYQSLSEADLDINVYGFHFLLKAIFPNNGNNFIGMISNGGNCDRMLNVIAGFANLENSNKCICGGKGFKGESSQCYENGGIPEITHGRDQCTFKCNR